MPSEQTTNTTNTQNNTQTNITNIASDNLRSLPAVLSLYFIGLAGVGAWLLTHTQDGNTSIVIGFVLIVLFVGGASVYYIISILNVNSKLLAENSNLRVENSTLRLQKLENSKRIDELEVKIDKLIKLLPKNKQEYVF